MKKFIYFSLVLVVQFCLVLAACDKTTYYWEVAQSVENISKIEIVEIENGEIETVICTIAPEFYEDLVHDVQTLSASKYFGSLTQPNGKSIIITFNDNTFDLISKYEPRHIIEPGGGFFHSGANWLCFRSDEFDQLIEKWIVKS